MPDLKAAGAICFAQENNKTFFLLLRSAKHGGWGPPKGHAQEHETEIETAVRELFEETGVRRPHFAPGFRKSITYNVEKKGKLHSKEVVFFLCQIDPDDVRLSQEHTEAHLATLDEIEVLIPHEDVRAVFRKAANHIHAHAD
jgi:8-oxo-dGTP pyrophosphatase MutT (NUDIX family)